MPDIEFERLYWSTPFDHETKVAKLAAVNAVLGRSSAGILVKRLERSTFIVERAIGDRKQFILWDDVFGLRFYCFIDYLIGQMGPHWGFRRLIHQAVPVLVQRLAGLYQGLNYGNKGDFKYLKAIEGGAEDGENQLYGWWMGEDNLTYYRGIMPYNFGFLKLPLPWSSTVPILYGGEMSCLGDLTWVKKLGYKPFQVDLGKTRVAPGFYASFDDFVLECSRVHGKMLFDSSLAVEYVARGMALFTPMVNAVYVI